jgi:hypothetical protein
MRPMYAKYALNSAIGVRMNAQNTPTWSIAKNALRRARIAPKNVKKWQCNTLINSQLENEFY